MGSIVNWPRAEQDSRVRLDVPDLPAITNGRRSGVSAIMEHPLDSDLHADSIGVGEDGPTHQPVEQLASLRAIPGLITLRPAVCERKCSKPGR